MHPIHSRRDPALSATVTSRRPLLYAAGADPALDRPAHVRSASSMARYRGSLAIVQDDAHFVALVDAAGQVHAVRLEAGPGGARQFDDLRATKHLKLDLEACVAVPHPHGERLLALGSGSTPRRERILLLEGQDGLQPRLLEAGALYGALRGETAFAGSELNVEGAVLVDRCVRLFNRGNGAPRGPLLPVNATVDLEWNALEAYLRDPEGTPSPGLGRVVRYDLGELGGLPLSFTDASLGPLGLLYCASAEDSPDAVADGPVAGSAVGVIGEAGARWIELRNPDGTLFAEKVEGICPASAGGARILLVVDPDDPLRPSELCEVSLGGPWSDPASVRP